MNEHDEIIGRIHGRDYCPVALPWFGFVRRRDELAWLRRRAYAWAARRHPVPRPLRVARHALAWPLRAARNARRAVATWGSAVQALDGTTRGRQFRQLYWLALTENVSPESFYAFGLWRDPHRARAARYLQEFEVMWACEMAHAGLDARVMKDKLRFFHACRAHGLPAIPVLAAVDGDGAVHWLATRPGHVAHDLFAKPAAMACGTGAQRWRYDPARPAWQRHGERLGWDELLGRLRRRAPPGGLLLQDFVANDASQAAWSGGALATLRVLACRLPGERARAVACTWRMPVGDAEVDNYSAGGISAPVSADGVIGPGRRKRIGPALDAHPDTAARFAGRPLPGFHALRALALRAHDALAFDGFVGWDVALSPDGPLLVEGNPTWGSNVLQASHDAPLGDAGVPALFAGLLAPPADAAPAPAGRPSRAFEG